MTATKYVAVKYTYVYLVTMITKNNREFVPLYAITPCFICHSKLVADQST